MGRHRVLKRYPDLTIEGVALNSLGYSDAERQRLVEGMPPARRPPPARENVNSRSDELGGDTTGRPVMPYGNLRTVILGPVPSPLPKGYS